ncbi:RNA polymerase sigma-54 factor [Campylobacterota bacterium]|nr:RNA polymerase sigma-54 factor [Campylobacterota bacterium]
MKLRADVGVKGKISATMRNWLPLLQCPIDELEAKLKLEAEINPFVHIETGNEISIDDFNDKDEWEDEDFLGFDDQYHRRTEPKSSISEAIEATTLVKDSLYDSLYNQITDHLFPTPSSKTIALELIKYIDEDGFFDGDMQAIAKRLGVSEATLEGVRKRFEYLTPCGVGAKDITECFLFQLREYDLDEELYQLVKTLIYNRENLSQFHREQRFSEAMTLFKRLRNPPAVDFMEESIQVIPDIFVFNDDGELQVKLNEAFYPTINIDDLSMLPEVKKEEFVRIKLKEARDLVDAVVMRKATLYKIGLMIINYQYDFFMGGAIKPMKLADISEDLGRNSSTISRAISGKYLACDRGVFTLKSFFSISIDETSTRAIKDFVQKLIKEEPRHKPLSDQKLLKLVQDQFKVEMVRRTITKYREQLNIATSGERKRLYLLG